MVGFLDESVHAALLQSELVEEELLVLIRVERGDVFLGLGRDDHGLGTLLGGNVLNLSAVIIACFGRQLVYVAHVEHRLGGQQKEVVGCLLLLLALEGHAAGVLPLVEHLLVGLEHLQQHLGILVARGGHLLGLGQLGLDGLQVFELQLGVDDVLVGQRVDGHAALAYHVVVVEAADDMDDGVALADVTEKLVA